MGAIYNFFYQDKLLDRNDPNKTIFNPKLNLECGVKILAQQIKRTKKIVLSKGVYWAVLKDPSVGKYSRVKEISTRVQKSIPDCK